jgi:hypothetical protein
MNRTLPSRAASVSPRPARAIPLRSARPLPKKKGILGRLFRWTLFLGIIGAIVASFFVKTGDGEKTYADLYTIPAYEWAKAKVFPPETEPEPAKKEVVPAAPSEFDTKFDDAVAQREKSEAAKAPEAADEAVSFLEKELEASGRRLDAVRDVGIEASKAAARKTKVAAARAVEELAAQARLQKSIAAALAKIQSSRDVKAALAALPPPPPPPPPPVVAYDLRRFHAWPAHPAGTWVRWKKTVEETVTHEDHVLATLTEDVAVVRIETVPANQTIEDRVFVFGADRARVVREESLKVGTTEIPCRVVQSGATLRWIPKEGPGADRVALKVQTGDKTVVVTELAEEEIPVKGEARKCLKIATAEATVWGHDDVPGFAVRVKTGDEIAEAIEWGADQKSRPKFAKKEAPVLLAEILAPTDDRSVKLLLADAEQLSTEGATMLRDVIEAMKEPPVESERLKALLLKSELASALLGRAWERSVLAKEKAPTSAAANEKVSKLARAIEIATEYQVSIQSRLK